MAARLTLVCLASLASLPVSALDLQDAWDTLRLQGPTYRAAMHERDAGLENRALGRAGLLPQINASASKNRIDGTQEQPNALGRTVENDLDYDSENLAVQLRQPLFNRQKLAEYRQGKQRADHSRSCLRQPRRGVDKLESAPAGPTSPPPPPSAGTREEGRPDLSAHGTRSRDRDSAPRSSHRTTRPRRLRPPAPSLPIRTLQRCVL